MKRFFFSLVFLMVSVWFGVQLKNNPSYLILGNKHGWLEMPAWFAIVGVLLAMLLVHVLWRVLNFSGGLSLRFKKWRGQHKQTRAHNLTIQGLIDLAEGNWSQAERYLLKAVKDSDTPLINYLGAARAAQEIGEEVKRDTYLKQAHKTTPQAEIAVGLTQAQLQLSHLQYEQGLATLQHLRHLDPSHSYVLKMLKNVYIELQDWDSLSGLLPDLRKFRVMKAKKLLELERSVTMARLEKARADKLPLAQLQLFWGSLSTELQASSEIVTSFVQTLILQDEHALAEKYAVKAIKKAWVEDLVYLFGKIKSPQPQQQLSLAESWLKEHGNDPVLLQALGRIAMANQQWGKAQDYLRNSLSLAPHSETYRELGQLLEAIDDKSAAADCYREGLLLR